MAGTKKMNGLGIGETGTIRNIAGNASLRRKLLDMGLTPGVKIEVVKVAPLGDPMDIKVRGYNLSLRKEEAAGINVEVDNARVDKSSDV